MDLIMPHATAYHPRIYAYTQKGNTAAEGIMTKWGFNKGEYNAKTNNHYWSFEQEENRSVGEHLLCKQRVAGSIPVSSTIFKG